MCNSLLYFCISPGVFCIFPHPVHVNIRASDPHMNTSDIHNKHNCFVSSMQRSSRCSGKTHWLGSSCPGFNPQVLHNLLEFVAWYPPSCYSIYGSLWVMPYPGRFRWVHLLNIMLGGRTPNRVFVLYLL
jgi:hypothetical protein